MNGLHRLRSSTSFPLADAQSAEGAAAEHQRSDMTKLHSRYHVTSRKIRELRMLTDFSIEYSQRSDDELLHLASDRHSLTTEAAAALDAELRRRKLTESDRVELQKFVKRQGRRQGRRRRLKIYGLKDRLTWRDILGAFAAMAVISFIYLVLPSRYHLKPDWEDSAVLVMIPSVVIASARSVSWRNFTFWMSLVMSSAIHLAIVHAWTQRVSILSRGYGKLAAMLGLVLWVAVYGFFRLLQRMFLSEERQLTQKSRLTRF
jgi:hypothetical protein